MPFPKPCCITGVTALSFFQRWLDKRIPWDETPSRLTRQRIYILPTIAGLFYALLLMILLLAASNYGTSLGFLLTFFLTGLSLVSMLHGFRNLLNLEIQIHSANAVFVGEESHFNIEIYNPNSSPHPMITLVHATQQHTLNLLADQRHRCTLSITTTRRGYLALGKVHINTLYPLGLFRCWSSIGSRQRVLIYPKPLSHSAPLPHVQDNTQQNNNQKIDEEYQGVRDYQRGDSARRIDWKALAKGHGTLVKNYQTPQNERLQLHWQLTQGDTERRLSQLCAWILQAERQQKIYSLHLPHSPPLIGRGEQHKQRCLKNLALFGLKDDE
ncbi:MAG: DUF58 domain-containing protein [Gammaproteobacteria bacterium]|nr:DUF58 domain-containing protein [Gammaproteobacteria bacterium]